MKHPVSRKRPGRGAEWLQALCTLLVLAGIYFSSSHFDAYESSLTTAPKKPVVLSEAYWNEKLGYGFRGNDSDSYQPSQGSAKEDHVKVVQNGVIYSDASVKVSFYKDKTLAMVEKIHNSSVARAFSTLPTGIAVIEGNLDSPTAKTILATLHAK